MLLGCYLITITILGRPLLVSNMVVAAAVVVVANHSIRTRPQRSPTTRCSTCKRCRSKIATFFKLDTRVSIFVPFHRAHSTIKLPSRRSKHSQSKIKRSTAEQFGRGHQAADSLAARGHRLVLTFPKTITTLTMFMLRRL